MVTHDFLAFCGDEFRDLLGELDGVVWSEPFFSCVDLGFDCDAVFRKKLLRLTAGDSSRAVVVPVYRFGHGPSSNSSE
jgi:hypothetical protein